MWLVEPIVAQHDLDNLRLEQLDAAMLHAEFELEALMLTGRCIDMQAKRRDLVGWQPCDAVRACVRANSRCLVGECECRERCGKVPREV